MKYIIHNKPFKKFFMVPCCIVDKYLKLASSDAIKVLLFILNTESEEFSTDDIIKETNIKDSNTIDEAIIFWQERGILEVNNNNNNSNNTQTSQTQQNAKNTKFEDNTKNKKISTVKYSPKDIANIIKKSDNLKFLVDNVQSVLNRPITYTEQNSLINLSEYYNFPPTVILMLIDYCNQIGKANVRYVEKIANSWCEKGIVTHEAAEAEIIRMIDRNTFEGKVKKIFGITTNLTPTQKKMIDQWNSLGFSIDMITFAWEKCLDSINVLSFPYINKILQSWAKNGYKSREDVTRSQSKDKKEKDNSKSYDIDEFYNMALNYTLNNKGE